METVSSFAHSKDGVRIAYDISGSGPGLILLHGGGQTRHAWHDAGYIARLQDRFTVVALDFRGNGESDKPADQRSYSINGLVDDVLGVADAVGLARFALWGFSYGGNVGRYIASRSERVERFANIGVGFGLGASGRFRDYVTSLCSKWTPAIEADRAGALDVGALPEQDRAMWLSGRVPLVIAQLGAMLDWPAVEPSDLRCPTLWLVGSKNEDGMASVQEYAERLVGTNVIVRTIAGLTHVEELTKIDEVLPVLLEFSARTPVAAE